MVDMVLQTLPKVAAEIAAPLTRFVFDFISANCSPNED